MATSIPDVASQVPAGGGVSKPASGSYGDVKELADLQSALPGMESAGGSGSPPPASVPPPPPAAPPPGGLPAALMAPSRNPGMPVSAPMTMPVAPPQTKQERMIKALDGISKDASMSQETKEWAQRVLNMVVRTPGE